ncbi:MAG: efflux RND transporter periplasmic adaptor subunit [Lachnospiraceae bacterium]|nr:efflux RND transporter periplasmic adaptor subunit [Lachnospiraceae bacterium]
MRIRKVACVLLSAVLLTGCGILPKEDSMRKAPVNQTALETQFFTVATVERGDVSSGYTAFCTYGTQKTENLAFSLPWENVTGLYVQLGDPVYEGELLAEITLGNLEYEIEECEKNCKQIDSDLEYYTQMLGFEGERKKLAEAYGRTFDTTTYDNLALKKSELEGQKAVADLKLKETQEQLKGRRLYASFDGVVTFVQNLNPWERTNTNTFITVKSTDSGFLSTVEDGSLFREGDVYNLETEEDVIPCTLVSITEAAQFKGRYSLVFLPVDETLEIEPGTNAMVRIVQEEAKNVIYIPTAALRTIGGKNAVYVVNSDGLREIRYIEIGLSINDYASAEQSRTEVRSGLSEGERVILR